MTEEKLEEIKKYKNYPEGSGMKRYYDSVFMSFSDYLNKYYISPDLSTWDIWQTKYLMPAFDENRHEEMVGNFGYVSIDVHDFKSQYEVYNQLKLDDRLDTETRKYIGFLAGADFFRENGITVGQWFSMENWINPAGKFEDWKGKTINDILSFDYGLNLLKTNFPQMPFWRR